MTCTDAARIDPWPTHLPRQLDVPRTNLWFNLQVAAERFPDKAAYYFLGATLTFRELLLQAEALAAWMQSRGLGAGDRVLLQMQNCPQFVIGFYASLRANAIVVPVNPMNQAGEIAHVLKDSGARLALCAADVAERLWQAMVDADLQGAVELLVTRDLDAGSGLGAADELWPAGFEPWLKFEPPWRPQWHRWAAATKERGQPGPITVGMHDVAMLAYTSGTTGSPKGCVHTHATLMHSAIAFARWQQMSTESRGLTAVPMFHITGLVTGVLSNIYLGATTVLMPRWNREVAACLIAQCRVTHFVCIPTMIIDLLASPQADGFDLSSLHNLCGGGAAMPEAVALALKQRFGIDFVEGYGLTETAAMTHMNPIARPKRQCLGIPTFGNTAKVIDPASGAEVGHGEAGEIVIHGPSLFAGYWQQPEASERCFVEIDGRRYFRTGDIGHVDAEGYFFLTDRLKRMINASGYKVWPAEVEALFYAHPGIQEACVIGARHAYRGETVKAVLVRKAGGEPVSAESLTAWAKGCMAAYKVPQIVEFVDELPKSASGKVLWRVLQEREFV